MHCSCDTRLTRSCAYTLALYCMACCRLLPGQHLGMVQVVTMLLVCVLFLTDDGVAVAADCCPLLCVPLIRFQVYDMSYGGIAMYGPGNTYNLFAGRDASVALAKVCLRQHVHLQALPLLSRRALSPRVRILSMRALRSTVYQYVFCSLGLPLYAQMCGASWRKPMVTDDARALYSGSPELVCFVWRPQSTAVYSSGCFFLAISAAESVAVCPS